MHRCLITSYASIFHRPGVPLTDLMQAGWAGRDRRMLFSWYGGDRTTDPDFAVLPPEERANPSMASWADPGYLAQQQRRLPAHKYRRLHLNLPGLPEGSAFQPEPIFDGIARGVMVRPPQPGIAYVGFVDMSGGSDDDAVLGIAHRDADDRAVLDSLTDQGQRPPFDPNKAVERFVRLLRDYRVSRVVGDRYAGETFRSQFTAQGITYEVAEKTTSELYEALEPRLNGGACRAAGRANARTATPRPRVEGRQRSRTSPASMTTSPPPPLVSWNRCSAVCRSIRIWFDGVWNPARRRSRRSPPRRSRLPACDIRVDHDDDD